MVIIVSSNWLTMLLPGLSAMTAGPGVVRRRPVAMGIGLKIVRAKNFISPDEVVQVHLQYVLELFIVVYAI